MDLGLKGKTALVTGGSTGIGRAVAQVARRGGRARDDRRQVAGAGLVTGVSPSP